MSLGMFDKEACKSLVRGQGIAELEAKAGTFILGKRLSMSYILRRYLFKVIVGLKYSILIGGQRTSDKQHCLFRDLEAERGWPFYIPRKRLEV